MTAIPSPDLRVGSSAAPAVFVVLLIALSTACASAGGSAGAYTRSLVTAEDLAAVPEMSLYDFLRQHSRIRITNPGGGEQIFVEDRTPWEATPQSQWRRADVYVNDRRVFDPIATVREIRTTGVARLEILTSTEASARYGREGYTPVVAIVTRG